MTERLLTVKEVASRLGLAKGSIYNLVSAGKLPAVRVFGALRFEAHKIQKLIEGGRINTQQHDEQLAQQSASRAKVER